MAADEPFARGSFLIPQSGTPVAIYFDVVETEVVTRDADITEFPVEVGANITDHYRVKVNSVRLSCFVSQEPIDPIAHPEGNAKIDELTVSWAPYPTPDVGNVIATAVVNPVGSILRAVGGTPTYALLPQVLQWQNQFDSLSSLLTVLDDLRSKATLIDVATKSAYYANMLMGPIETTRDKGTGSGTRITIELKEIVTVATQQVAAPPIPEMPKDKKTEGKGPQQPTPPAEMESLASAAVSAAKAFF